MAQFLTEFIQSAWGYFVAGVVILSLPALALLSAVRRQPLRLTVSFAPFELHLGYSADDDDNDPPPPMAGMMVPAGGLDALGGSP